MKLRTLIPVSYADSINTLTEGIIEGKMMGNTQSFKFGYESIFGYEYKTVDGVSVKTSSAIYTKEEVNTLYELVKSQLPIGLSYVDASEYLYYLGMRVEMAKTFSITIDNIEIITE